MMVEKTEQVNDLTAHHVSLRADRISEFSSQIADGPWYARFWQPGTDDAQVVFKDKVFNITVSDTASWQDAISYATSLGIPKEQLDFSSTDVA